MTKEGWIHIIEFANENAEAKEILAKVLQEYDLSKQRLIEKGYGVTGTPLIVMVNEVKRK
jgi:hypothetical protein